MSVKGMPVLTGVLTEQRRSLMVWALAVVGVSSFYISFYPSIGESPAMQEVVDSMPAGLAQALGYDQISSAAGYIGATVYGLLGPVLLLVFGLGTGARLIAGEEESGALELEVAHPIGRMRLAGERFVAIVIDLIVLVLAAAVATVALVLVLDLDVELGNVLAMATGLFMFALAFASVSFAIGAATGRRAVALGATAGIAVMAYLANGIGPQIEGGQWMEAISPWFWYLGNDPLMNGFDPGGLALLATVVLLAVPAALFSFANRDFGT